MAVDADTDTDMVEDCVQSIDFTTWDWIEEALVYCSPEG